MDGLPLAHEAIAVFPYKPLLHDDCCTQIVLNLTQVQHVFLRNATESEVILD
jgi:hypothetical protein